MDDRDSSPSLLVDALIVAAARRQRCSHLLSEDLSDGAEFDGLRVVNPFAHGPDELLADGSGGSVKGRP